MYKYNVLAVSSSRVGSSAYLEMAVELILNHIGHERRQVAFIPFAAADNRYLDYGKRVAEALKNLPYSINVVLPSNAEKVIAEADAIMVGGGNTFKLLHDLYQLQLLELLKTKTAAGTPYVGWSAGANITGLTIGTTNDMPIIEPGSFHALGIFPFQINPHYHNQIIDGFNGETRDQRLEEYLKVNPGRQIIGLPEGTALQLKQNKLIYIGLQPAVLFSTDERDGSIAKRLITEASDLEYLLI